MQFRNIFIAACFAVALAGAPAVLAADAPEGFVVVRQGQNLHAIAALHNVSVAQLLQWNKLSSPDKILVGQKLRVRPPDAAAAPEPQAKTAGAKPDKKAAPAPAKADKARPDKKTEPAPAALAPAKADTAGQKTAPAPRGAQDGVPENVRQELDKAAGILVSKAAKSIMPSIRSKAVAPAGGGGYVASYVEVDASDLRTEVLPSSESGKYVGSIRYVERQYECLGASKADALQAECRVVKSRRMNELIRYEKGKWHY